MERIGDSIAQKRRELGLTQAELGHMLGISGKAVSKWERGLANPCREHMEKLVDLLGLPVEPTTPTASAKQIPPPHPVRMFLRELPRIVPVSLMLATCACHVRGILSTDSTVVSLGLSSAAFCFLTMIRR